MESFLRVCLLKISKATKVDDSGHLNVFAVAWSLACVNFVEGVLIEGKASSPEEWFFSSVPAPSHMTSLMFGGSRRFSLPFKEEQMLNNNAKENVAHIW